MRDAVRKAFVPLTISLEGGYITWMFPDVKGLVSTGFGLLLDPVALALALPWRRPDGSLATREEVVADWANVKNYPDAPRLGHLSVKNVARLRLDEDGLDRAFQGKMNSNETVLRKGFSEWDDWPADAQLGVMSMAWAVGPAFYIPGHGGWPKLTEVLRAKDFRAAAVECFMPEEATIGGLRPRNRANGILFTNAAYSQELGLDPDTLYWPNDLAALPVDRNAETQPEIIVHPSPYQEPDDEPPAAA